MSIVYLPAMSLGFNLVLRIFLLLLLSGLVALSVGCSSSNDSAVLPEVEVDTTAPGIIQVLPPELPDNLVNTNSEVEMVFNELLDEGSLPNSVKLKSLKGRNLNSTFSLGSNGFTANLIDERPISFTISEYLFTRTFSEIIRETINEDGVPEREERTVTEEVPASIVHVAPESGRLSLWSTYSLEIESGVRDRSQVESISPVDGSSSVGNYLDPFFVQFGTEDGAWRSARDVNGTFFLDTYDVPHFAYASSRHVGAVMWIQRALVPSTFSHLYLREFDQNAQAFSGGPQRVDFVASVDGIPLNSESVGDFDVKAAGNEQCFSWSSEAVGVTSVYLRCRNDDGYQGRLLLASHASTDPISFLQLEVAEDGSGFVSYIYNGQYFVYAFEGANQAQVILLDSISSDGSVDVLEQMSEVTSVGEGSALNVVASISDPALPADSRYRIEHHTLTLESGSLFRTTLLVSEGPNQAEELSIGFDYLGRGLISWIEGVGKNRNYYTSSFDTIKWLAKIPVLKNGEATILAGSAFVFNDGQAVFSWVEELNGSYEIKAQGVFASEGGNSFVRPRVLTLLTTNRAIDGIKVIGDREGNAFVYFNDGQRASSFRFRQNIEWTAAWGGLVDLGLTNRELIVQPLTEDGRMALLTIEQVFGHDTLRLNVFSDFD